jgi:hypothetical protein
LWGVWGCVGGGGGGGGPPHGEQDIVKVLFPANKNPSPSLQSASNFIIRTK